jgi:hypothetical protein
LQLAIIVELLPLGNFQKFQHLLHLFERILQRLDHIFDVLNGIGNRTDRAGQTWRRFRATHFLWTRIAIIIAARFLPASVVATRIATALLLPSRIMALALLRWALRRRRRSRWGRWCCALWRLNVINIRGWLGFRIDLEAVGTRFHAFHIRYRTRVFLALVMLMPGFGRRFMGLRRRGGWWRLDRCRSWRGR